MASHDPGVVRPRTVPSDRVAYRWADDVRVVDHEGGTYLVGDAVRGGSLEELRQRARAFLAAVR